MMQQAPLYQDRAAAGRELATHLPAFADRRDVVVLGLPRGGVPVAFEVARLLDAALDVFVVRKLGVPGQEELAMGAVASGGARVVNADVLEALHISPQTLDEVTARERAEVERRELQYRGDRPAPELRGQTVILVDDGLATGATMLAAVRALRAQHPAKLVVAVPVAAAEICEFFSNEADEVYCAATPQPFHAVGLWYREFTQVTDEEVREYLRRAAGDDGEETVPTTVLFDAETEIPV
jgi:putative phosphoribosyl transferase